MSAASAPADEPARHAGELRARFAFQETGQKQLKLSQTSVAAGETSWLSVFTETVFTISFPKRNQTMKNGNVQSLAPRPIEPAAAYDNAHQISRDLLQHIELQLDRMLKPDNKALRWTHVRAMNLINAQLSEVAALVDETNGARN